MLAHNDLNNTNILYDKEKDTLKLIDYEFAGFNYRSFEFGNFFNELTWNYELDEPPYFQVNENNYPTIEM